MFLADTLQSIPPFMCVSWIRIWNHQHDELPSDIWRAASAVPAWDRTDMDNTLQVLKSVIQGGWPEDKNALPSVISSYFNMWDEMSVQDGLFFKGERVAVPKAARGVLLWRIHNSHLGVNSLNRAHECLYWPGMAGDIKNHMSTCEACR